MRTSKKIGTGIVAVLLLALAVFTAVAAARSTAVPKNTSQPQIIGNARVGSTLTSTTGTWENSPTSYKYKWLRCDTAGPTNCVDIAGATASSYKLTSTDKNHTIESVVTAVNASGSASANSTPVGPVAADTAPSNTSPPTISGSAQVGSVLTAGNGTWTGAPDSYTYKWLQCDGNGNGCVTITGATAQAYTVRSADTDHTLRVDVTAHNPKGKSTAISQPSDIVGSSGGGGGGGSSISVSAVSLPNLLVISNVSFQPSVLTSRAPFTARFKVTDLKGHLIRGALVYGIALPYGIVGTAPEASTDSTGVATIVFTPTVRLALRPGFVVFFVRARKPGENLLAGVSTRRLVQVTVR